MYILVKINPINICLYILCTYEKIKIYIYTQTVADIWYDLNTPTPYKMRIYGSSLTRKDCSPGSKWEAINTIRPDHNGWHSADNIFKCIFVELNIWTFKWKFLEICSIWSKWQYISISSGNGLMPNRWQASIYTKDYLVHWHIYASPSINIRSCPRNCYKGYH